MATMRIKKNDVVEVTAGVEKGKRGKVLRIISEKGRVVVEKVKMMKRHTRPSGSRLQGGIIEREASIHISNVMVVCNKCDRAVRVGRKALGDGKRVRYCKNCGELLEE